MYCSVVKLLALCVLPLVSGGQSVVAISFPGGLAAPSTLTPAWCFHTLVCLPALRAAWSHASQLASIGVALMARGHNFTLLGSRCCAAVQPAVLHRDPLSVALLARSQAISMRVRERYPGIHVASLPAMTQAKGLVDLIREQPELAHQVSCILQPSSHCHATLQLICTPAFAARASLWRGGRTAVPERHGNHL